MMSSSGVKRSANSPLSDDEEKRHRVLGDSIVDDPDATIIDSSFLRSTVLDDPAHTMSVADSTIKEQLKAELCDPGFLDLVSGAVAARVSDRLLEELAGLKEKLLEKDREISLLKDQVDALEQYSRRNCVRIGPVPESADENTDEIVKAVAKSVGVNLTDDAIDRSHRVGKKSATATRDRPILVRLTSYRHKEALMKARRALKQIDGAKIVPSADWPPLARNSGSSATPASRKIFINEDLTRIRAHVAAKARQLKRDQRISDTWTRDGFIFVKKNNSSYKIATMRELAVFAVD